MVIFHSYVNVYQRVVVFGIGFPTLIGKSHDSERRPPQVPQIPCLFATVIPFQARTCSHWSPCWVSSWKAFARRLGNQKTRVLEDWRCQPGWRLHISCTIFGRWSVKYGLGINSGYQPQGEGRPVPDKANRGGSESDGPSSCCLVVKRFQMVSKVMGVTPNHPSHGWPF